MMFFSIIRNLVVGVATSVVTFVSPPALPSPTPVVSPQPTIIKTKTHSGNYAIFGKSVSYSLSIPESDGPITGNFTGDCQGAINGTRTGTLIEGQITGNCDLGFYKPVIKADFNGTIAGSTADINYQVTSPVSKSGSTNLPLN